MLRELRTVLRINCTRGKQRNTCMCMSLVMFMLCAFACWVWSCVCLALAACTHVSCERPAPKTLVISFANKCQAIISNMAVQNVKMKEMYLLGLRYARPALHQNTNLIKRKRIATNKQKEIEINRERSNNKVEINTSLFIWHFPAASI